MFDVVFPSSAIAVLLLGMLALAVYDLLREEVPNWGTVLLGAGVLIALVHDGVTPSQWAYGILTAGLAFWFYLTLGIRGTMGGGDVKLVPVPALVLGVIHPVLALWAIALSFAVQTVVQIGVQPTNRTVPVALPHVPSMAVGAVAAAAFGANLTGF